MVITVGSICSGIEAASVAWEGTELKVQWVSEIAKFPTEFLKHTYPSIPNHGDLSSIPEKIKAGEIVPPDMICGGTPCQAFSMNGSRKGLEDERGNLTLKFVDIIEQNDETRLQMGLGGTTIFWENVVGVLSDKTNAFGCLLAALAGYDTPLTTNKSWPLAGIVRGPKRNIAWRVLDAKYFGVCQRRRRVYLMAGGKDFFPEKVLFDEYNPTAIDTKPNFDLTFNKDGYNFELFRDHTACILAGYGPSYSDEFVAGNSSVFVVQDGAIRNFSPLECERLMGFADNYTNVLGATNTKRYHALGNSWAVPVIKWLGSRLVKHLSRPDKLPDYAGSISLILPNAKKLALSDGTIVNCSDKPTHPNYGNIYDVVDGKSATIPYLSLRTLNAMIQRGIRKNLKLHPRLVEVLKSQFGDQVVFTRN